MNDPRSSRQPAARPRPDRAAAPADSRPRSPRQSTQSGSRPRSSSHPNQSASRPRPAGQPAQSGSRPRPRNSKRRRRARLYFRIRQLLLILIALAIGYFFGFRAGAAIPEPTPKPAVSDSTTPSGETEPPQGPADTIAPQLMGVNKLSIFLGSTISYRSGILLSDDLDPNPKLSIDSSRVNLSAPGTYPVVYTATDSAGNATSVETTITVVEAPDTYVDEAVIKEKADKILDRILTDDMTLEKQINVIYDYIENHHYYVAKFDKSDYMQAAYLMMTENRGDCFGYYALARLFFERLGIPNLTVTRTPNEVRPTNHWWNMVSLDGGQTWYHYDSTPHLTYPTRTCLITDADLEAFNELMPNYYYFDHNSFPKTPVE